MTGFLVRRTLAALGLVFLVLTLLFFVVRLAPGKPTAFYENERMPLEQRQELEQALGLDRPLGLQYVLWLKAAATGQWGVSLSYNRPVAGILLEHLPKTLLLSGTALLLQYGFGLLLGVASARRAGKAADKLIRYLSLLLYSLPGFWLGLMALLLLSYRLQLFPGGQMHSVGAESLAPGAYLLDLLHHLVLPAAVLGIGSCGSIARFVRNSLLDVLDEDYIRTARAKGVSERAVIWRHALRNSLTSLTQLVGLSVPFLLSGALVTEVVFSWPGMGRVAYDALSTRDYPLILGATAVTALLVVLGSLLADLLQGAVDPRVRRA